jgi:hypothetical protein
LKGKILNFPINRCDTTLPGNPGGQLLSGSTNEAICAATPGQYDIIGFFAAKLVEIYGAKDPAVTGSAGTCNQPRQMPGPNNPFSLEIFGQSAGCFASPPDSISNISIVKDKNNDPGPQPQINVDYTVDTSNPADPVVTWIAPIGKYQPNQTFKVSFDWMFGGACGVPPANNASGHCMILQPVEVQIGGTHPGQGIPDSNLRAVKLCEPTIPGSCSPVSVPNP